MILSHIRDCFLNIIQHSRMLTFNVEKASDGLLRICSRLIHKLDVSVPLLQSIHTCITQHVSFQHPLLPLITARYKILVERNSDCLVTDEVLDIVFETVKLSASHEHARYHVVISLKRSTRLTRLLPISMCMYY